MDDTVLPTEEEHAIRERLAKATPGPWSARGVNVWGPHHLGEETTIAHLALTYGKFEIEAQNADFIAHAPTDIARLLDALDTERTRRETAEAALRTTREALAFYADARNWDAVLLFTVPKGGPNGGAKQYRSGPANDGGEHARMVLEPPQAPNEQPAP